MGIGAELYAQLFITPPYPSRPFSGQTVIVTGANVGLGKEASRHFARLGANKVILAVRSIAKGEAAKESIVSTTKCDSDVVEVWQLDLCSYASVKAFAARAARLPRLDAVVENAAIATTKYSVAEDNESTITVNVISTMLLAVLLIPLLRKSAKNSGVVSRLTIVTSDIHGWTKLPEWRSPNTFDKLNDEKTANMKMRYPASKLLEIFAVRELAPLVSERDVIINMLSPGLCDSELTREHSGFTVWLTKRLLARTVEVGSRTLVLAAAAGSETHGKYLDDGKIKEGRIWPFVRSEEGKQAQQKVWKELVGKLEKIEPDIMDAMHA